MHRKTLTLPDKRYARIEDRFIDSGLSLAQQPIKTYEGPPYDVALVDFILEQMMEGYSLSAILRDDPTLPRNGEFMTYIRRRPELWQRFLDARHARAEIYRDKFECSIEGKDEFGNEVLEDVQRSRLKAEGYKFLMMVENRELYGEKKQIDITQKIDLTDAMKAAEQRVQNREKVIEGEVIKDDDTLKLLGLDE